MRARCCACLCASRTRPAGRSRWLGMQGGAIRCGQHPWRRRSNAPTHQRYLSLEMYPRRALTLSPTEPSHSDTTVLPSFCLRCRGQSLCPALPLARHPACANRGQTPGIPHVKIEDKRSRKPGPAGAHAERLRTERLAQKRCENRPVRAGVRSSAPDVVSLLCLAFYVLDCPSVRVHLVIDEEPIDTDGHPHQHAVGHLAHKDRACEGLVADLRE